MTQHVSMEAPAVTLHVIEPGLLTTVQDTGRPGLGRYGVPVSGAMDPFSMRLANVLVGNPEAAAGLEVTLAGPTLGIEADAVLAVCGAMFELRLERRQGPAARVPPATAFRVRAGDRLRFGRALEGARAYLGIRGGIDLPPVLGSRSTFLPGGWGGLSGRALRAGDRLLAGAADLEAPLRYLPRDAVNSWSSLSVVRVIPGPQADAFPDGSLDRLLSVPWRVDPRSDRIGVRLAGPALEHLGPADIAPEGLAPGTLQVPADGQPIVLMADRPATGGYAKIATVITADLSLVAQLRPGDTLRFQQIGLEEARAAWRGLDVLLRGGWQVMG